MNRNRSHVQLTIASAWVFVTLASRMGAGTLETDSIDRSHDMKKLIIALGFIVGSVGVSQAGSIRVENHDSGEYVVELKCSGSSAKIEIRGSATATYTFHSTSSSCDIVGGSVKFPVSKLEDGQKWKIKDGAAKPN